MSVPAFEVLAPGMLTTVQDRGRYGYQRIGVPVSGAMDEFALRAANLLIGNYDGQAGLEMTVVGPTVRFLTDTWIAVTGADMSATVDGEPLPRWRSVEVKKGSELSFPELVDGMRAYLAIAGGLDVPVVMGSRSTYIKADIGGHEGRALERGDVLHALPVEGESRSVERRPPHRYPAPIYGEDHEIRIVLGPQHRALTEEAIATFLSSIYVVAQDSDRMGYRLEGPQVSHESGPDIVSDGNPLGAVQVPGDGIPLVLLADRGTTGGYTKIATVISSDIGALAQAVPGHSITFKAVTVEDAVEVLRDREDILKAISSGQAMAGSRDGSLNVVVDGEAFEVVGDDGEQVSQRELLEGIADGNRYQARATVEGRTYEFDVEVKRGH